MAVNKIEWECPYTLKSGRECGKKHPVAWDTEFDSPCDGESLLCKRHEKYDTECGVNYNVTR